MQFRIKNCELRNGASADYTDFFSPSATSAKSADKTPIHLHLISVIAQPRACAPRPVAPAAFGKGDIRRLRRLHRFLFPHLRHLRNLRIKLPVRLHPLSCDFSATSQISVIAQPRACAPRPVAPAAFGKGDIRRLRRLHRFLFPHLRHLRNLRIKLPVRLHPLSCDFSATSQISVIAQPRACAPRPVAPAAFGKGDIRRLRRLHRFLFPHLRHLRNLRIKLPVRLHPLSCDFSATSQISVIAQPRACAPRPVAPAAFGKGDIRRLRRLHRFLFPHLRHLRNLRIKLPSIFI